MVVCWVWPSKFAVMVAFWLPLAVPHLAMKVEVF
jgi:hypothetical protein